LCILDIEKLADDLAKSWGFTKEIEQMRKESVIRIFGITYKKDYKLEAPCNNSKLSLICPICKRKCEGVYYYTDIERVWCSITIYDQKVPKGYIQSGQPMSAEDMLNSGYHCHNCEKGKLVIKKKRNITYDADEVMRKAQAYSLMMPERSS
jgi:hypothetical protein